MEWKFPRDRILSFYGRGMTKKKRQKQTNNKIMTSKVDMGQNKTIKVTQCSFLLDFLMWHQIGFFLLQQGMKSSQLSLLGGNKGIPICYKKVSAYKHSQCSTKLCHMNFNVTQVWKIPKEQRQHSPVPHYTNDLFWSEQHTTLQSNLFQRRVTQIKCNGC